MNFLKKNSYSIVRMVLDQFGIMIFAIILTAAASSQNETARTGLMLAVSIYSTLFYMALLYILTWECGAKDRIRVDGGRERRDLLAGLKMSLLANIPNFLIVLLLVIGFLFGAAWGEAAWAQTMFAITHGVAKLAWESMYTGIVIALLPPASVSAISPLYILAYTLTILPALGASTFGYLMGYHNKKIFPSRKNKG